MKREAEKKVENLENRDTARIDHTSSLQVQDIASEKIYKARMFNYSKEGIYFESGHTDLHRHSKFTIRLIAGRFGISPGTNNVAERTKAFIFSIRIWR
jgi:hypothetical protein